MSGRTLYVYDYEGSEIPEERYREASSSEIVDAARRFLALTETDQVGYCKEHRSMMADGPESPNCCWFIMFVLRGTNRDWKNPPNHLPCRPVRVQLIPADYLTEEE